VRQGHIASRSRLALSQTTAALRGVLPSRAELQAHQGPLPGGALDLVAVQSASIRSTAPRALLGELWSRVAPGGTLVQLDDPLLSPQLRAYVEFLCTRVGDNITATHDLLLHPEADGFLRKLLGPAPPQPLAGLDPREVLPRLSAGAHCLLSRSFGVAADHPLTPFAAIGPPDRAAFPTWISSAWRKD
jgi:hypothetical protein